MAEVFAYWGAAYEFGSKFIYRFYSAFAGPSKNAGRVPHPAAPDRTSFRADINGLRGLSVIILLLFHLQVPAFSGGFIGVDVFFVISGFLITRIIVSRLEEGQFSFAQFYTSRFIRLAPAFLAMVGATMAIGWFVADPVLYRSMATEAASAALVISNLLFFSESGYFTPAALDSWFIHTWSLSVEWQFYLVYPVALLLIHRFLPRYMAPLIAMACAGSLGLEVLLHHLGGARMASFLFYMLPSRAWELLLGACVYFYPLGVFRGRRVVEAVGIGLIVASSVLFKTWPALSCSCRRWARC